MDWELIMFFIGLGIIIGEWWLAHSQLLPERYLGGFSPKSHCGSLLRFGKLYPVKQSHLTCCHVLLLLFFKV
jgi:hypothetical protein